MSDLPFLRFSLKREMRVLGEDCGLQPVTIAMAFVYFEKLVLQGRLNKQNRYNRMRLHAGTEAERQLIQLNNHCIAVSNPHTQEGGPTNRLVVSAQLQFC